MVCVSATVSYVFTPISVARSPVYSHFCVTLQGLSTIRTLCMEDKAHELLHRYQNEHTQVHYTVSQFRDSLQDFDLCRSICTFFYLDMTIDKQGWHLYLVTQRWFGLRIDMITAFYLGAVAFISVPLAESKSVLNIKMEYFILVTSLSTPFSHSIGISSALDAGVVGLGLAYTISLAGILQFCVRQSAEVENIVS